MTPLDQADRPPPRRTGVGRFVPVAAVVLAVGAAWTLPACTDGRPVVRVGTKSFTESYILGEIVADVIEQAGEARVERTFGLGGTAVVYRAVLHGDVDLYPEYTGTLSQAILKNPAASSVEDVRRELQGTGLTIGGPLGFNNTYALAVRRETAETLGVQAISDLKEHPQFSAAFSTGFSDREDGWPGLRQRYGLELDDVRVMEHSLTYGALVQGEVDIIDIYSTDGKLERLDLVVLDDDLDFFPAYEAVLVVREDFIPALPRELAGPPEHPRGPDR